MKQPASELGPRQPPSLRVLTGRTEEMLVTRFVVPDRLAPPRGFAALDRAEAPHRSEVALPVQVQSLLVDVPIEVDRELGHVSR